MVMDKIALTLLIIGGLNWGSVGHDQPGDLHPGGAVCRVVHLAAVPGQGPGGAAQLRLFTSFQTKKQDRQPDWIGGPVCLIQ